MEDKISVPIKGLSTDTSYSNQPESTYSFALNAVTESNEGDFQTLSNENSNEIFAQIKPNYVLIGSIYIGDGETCLFSVKNDNSESEIGILSEKKNKYEVWCNDKLSDIKNKLNFKINKQIQATFRLRRGCEKLVYWTDNFNVPRQVNLNDKKFFIDNDKSLKLINFNIIKDVNSSIELEEIELVEGAGFFKPGSVKFLVRYLDKNKVPTRFLYESKNILLFKDSLNNKYFDIDGDMYVKDVDAFKNTVVNKSLKIKFKNLDEEYAFYQVAYIMYNDSTGLPSESYISELYSTKQNIVIYNGVNHKEKISLEEIKLSKQSFNIEKAKSITQKDDRLLLANTKSKNMDFKHLQKYASKIKTDCLLKKISITSLDKHNPKNPTSLIDGTGFKFGEIYSFGIVYVFEDGLESPVFHIPGRIGGDTILDTEYDNSNNDLIPMSGNNESENLRYIERETCKNFSYWGKDYLGNDLTANTPVRFHRFPTRKQAKVPLFEDKGSIERVRNNFNLTLLNSGIKDSNCNKCKTKKYNCVKIGEDTYSFTPLEATIKYKVNGEEKVLKRVLTQNYFDGTELLKLSGDNLNIEFYGSAEFKALKGSYKKIITTTTTTTEQGTSQSSTITYEKINDNGVDFNSDNTPIMLPDYIQEQSGNVETDTSGNITTTKTTYNIYFYKKIIGDNIDGQPLSETYHQIGVDKSVFYILRSLDPCLIAEGQLTVPPLIIETSFKQDKIVEDVKETTIAGIHFSNIDLPSENLLGKKCVGYYIVKQKIKESDNTIIDNVVLLPTFKSGGYIINGLYHFNNTCNASIRLEKAPSISNSDFVVLGMRNKFRDYNYSNADILEIEGYYTINETSAGGYFIQNVTDGKEDNIKGESGYTADEDGIDLKNIIKDLTTTFNEEEFNKITIDNTKVDYFQLNPYSFKTKEYTSDILANMDMLNRVDILSLKPEENSGIKNLVSTIGNSEIKAFVGNYKRNHKTYYEDFRTAPYERVNSFLESGKSYSNFCGDSIVGGYRHTTTACLGTTVRKHAKKGDALNAIKIVAGTLLIVAGIFTGGATAIIGSLLIGGGAIVLGVKGMISIDEFNAIMDKHLNLGILDCFTDDLYYNAYIDNCTKLVERGDNKSLSQHYLGDPPSPQQDNIIKYYSQAIGDFIFETDINFQLRVKSEKQEFDYIQPFSQRMPNKYYTIKPHTYNVSSDRAGNVDQSTINNIFYKTDVWYEVGDTTFERMFQCKSIGVPIDNTYYNYFLNKVCKVNPNRKGGSYPEIGGYEYRGIPESILYIVNRDYSVFEDLLSYYMIPFEYSFCSDCEETFPQRFIWSEKDFQESLSDNYTKFLPNNYKDVSGKYGDITNIFVFNNNLFIHTEEGLWIQPTNPQQQMLNDVTVYIGTGEFGDLPAQLIIDDSNGTSAGLQHREAQILTPYGYFFVSEREGKIYKFDGKLQPISDINMSKWFNDNITIELDKQYRNNNGVEYPYRDNPSNDLGTGFILTYDRERERVLITKKDYLPNQEIIKEGSDLCYSGGNYVFLDVKRIKEILESSSNQDLKNNILSTVSRVIDDEGNTYNYTPKPEDKYTYLGIDNCEMKFEITTSVKKQFCTTVKKKIKVSKDTNIIAFYDRTSMLPHAVENLRSTLQEWFPQFKSQYNSGDNSINFIDCETDWSYQWMSENWLVDPQELVLKRLGDNKDVILLLFVDETNNYFHHHLITNPMEKPRTGYIHSVDKFVKQIYPRFKSLICINYPIVRDSQECFEYLQHTIASIEARNMTIDEVNNLKKNPIIPDNLWNIIKNNLQNNPYVGQPILKNYNFLYKENRSTNAGQNISENCPAVTGKVISPCMFTEDIQNLLGQLEEREIEETECIYVDEIKTLYLYIPGTPTTSEGIINNSWTLSYSLKYNTWTSFHSYIPNFYFRMNEKYFSWVNGNNNIYLHNKNNHYQEFYGNKYPYIIEYVSNSNPIVTKIFDHIRFLTEAYKYDNDTKELYNERFITFNKAVLYNTRQCSGELNLRVKDITQEQQDYLEKQILNENNNVIFLDRNEKDWLLNDFRDYIINYNKPIWNKDKTIISQENNSKFIDKVLNTSTIDLNKDWYDLESFRDKFLVVRLSFDNFASDIKLILNLISEDKTISNY